MIKRNYFEVVGKGRGISLVLIIFIFICGLETGSSLRCNKCDEKQKNLEWCSQPQEEDCESNHGHESICLKYVYKAGKKNWPNHIVFRCVPRSDYSQNQINACDRHTKSRSDGSIFLFETCTCDKDLCNDKELTSSLGGSDIKEIDQQESENERGNEHKERDENTIQKHGENGDHELPDKEARRESKENLTGDMSSGQNSQRNWIDRKMIIGIIFLHLLFLITKI